MHVLQIKQARCSMTVRGGERVDRWVCAECDERKAALGHQCAPGATSGGSGFQMVGLTVKQASTCCNP